MSQVYHCCSEARRLLVIASALNAIDFVEIPAGDQRTIRVRFLKPAGVSALTHQNFRIAGGERIRSVQVIDAVPLPGTSEIMLRASVAGDFSSYELQLVASPSDSLPPAGFDPVLSRIRFSFKAACPTTFDPLSPDACASPAPPPPAISYLAKDYASFRTLMLDRIATIAPHWRGRDRSAADAGIMLVELVAHVGDLLSYRQDAVATEAYLDTARRRISVRRHARLVDYHMHDGCNARAWVQLQVIAERRDDLLPAGVTFLTTDPRFPVVIPDTMDNRRHALAGGSVVFQAMHATLLSSAHNEMRFHTWAEEPCCLPRGATRAFLADPHEELDSIEPGMVLLFEEVRNPVPGDAASAADRRDADPAKRHIVRLTRVITRTDPMFSSSSDLSRPLRVIEIEWDAADALPFPLCLDSLTGPTSPLRLPVSVARGNMVLADHGATVIEPETLSVPVRSIPLVRFAPHDDDWCTTRTPTEVPARFNPALREGPVTQGAPYREVRHAIALPAPLRAALDGGAVPSPLGDELLATLVGMDPGIAAISVRTRIPERRWIIVDRFILQRDADTDTGHLIAPVSASASFKNTPADALPAVALAQSDNGVAIQWTARRDLLESEPSDPEFVVEVETDSVARLRFGDGVNGRRPEAGDAFSVTYRVGNAGAGNVGAETITHAILPASLGNLIVAVRNPLPAAGGVEPEGIDKARQRAPFAMRTNLRAVTPEDYAERASSHPAVQRAVATIRFTGSWRTVFLTVDLRSGAALTPEIESSIRAHVEPFRLAGYDLEVEAPVLVPLFLELLVNVACSHLREHVQRALEIEFSSGTRPDGSPGFFHPDSLSFGEPVLLSRVYAAAQGVPGVESVIVTAFRRQDDPEDTAALAGGEVSLGRREIATLANDPNFPDRGTLVVRTRGGR